MKAIKVLFDNVFLANDGNQYYIDTNKGEVIEAIYGDYPPYREVPEDDYLGWINDNFDRWELDVE